ncbi:hypothetical protein B566_EDAN009177 [Ephemera danica]|nr:hypothetical protein B566_EDAN009177 [Ephemera danica]
MSVVSRCPVSYIIHNLMMRQSLLLALVLIACLVHVIQGNTVALREKRNDRLGDGRYPGGRYPSHGSYPGAYPDHRGSSYPVDYHSGLVNRLTFITN